MRVVQYTLLSVSGTIFEKLALRVSRLEKPTAMPARRRFAMRETANAARSTPTKSSAVGDWLSDNEDDHHRGDGRRALGLGELGLQRHDELAHQDLRHFRDGQFFELRHLAGNAPVRVDRHDRVRAVGPKPAVMWAEALPAPVLLRPLASMTAR